MPQFERRPLAVAIALVFSCPGWVAAQSEPVVVAQSTPSTPPPSTPAPSTPAPSTLPEVKAQATPDDMNFRTDATRSSTRTETPLRDIPQFINIVPQSLIRSQNATTLQDALRNVPGISYAAAEGGTQANQVFPARLSAECQDIFIDGVRDLGEYNRDLFATESVEVLEGLVGADVRPRLDRRPHQPDQQGRRPAGAEGSRRHARLVRPEARHRRPELPDWRQAVRCASLGSARTRAATAIRRTSNKLGFAPSFWFNVGNGDRHHAVLLLPEASDVTDYGQPTLFTATTGFFGFPPVSPQVYYGFANHDYADHETHIATFTLDHQFNDDAEPAQHAALCANYKRNLESTIAQGVNATDANGAAVTAARRRHCCWSRATTTAAARATTTTTRSSTRPSSRGSRRPARSSTRCWPGSSSRTRSSTAATTCSTPTRRTRARRRRRRSLRSSNPDPYTQLTYTKYPT